MPIDLRSRVALLSFAYSDPDALKGFAPVLACLSDPAGHVPGPEDDYGPADAAGLSAVLAARSAHDATPIGTPENRTAHLYELLQDLKRRVDEQGAVLSRPAMATAVAPAEPEAVVASANTPADENRDHLKPWLRRWLLTASRLAVVGIATFAGYSIFELERRIGTSEKPGTISERIGTLEDRSVSISQRLVHRRNRPIRDRGAARYAERGGQELGRSPGQPRGGKRDDAG